MAEFIFLPAVYIGLVIGLYEMFLVHKDEAFRGSHWLKHGWHALLVTMFFVFLAMNVDFIYSVIPGLETIPILSNILIIRIAIGLLAMVKVHAAAAVIKSSGLGPSIGETWAHSFVIAILITTSPYIWPFLEPFVAGTLKLPI
ncbi:MAG: hypothetical protein Q8R00_03695 [Candidatus Nanoarchaeia archaeon]|nr:hypothetical protein [Candidatus Nanoarchaeia archaeon]